MIPLLSNCYFEGVSKPRASGDDPVGELTAWSYKL